VNGNSYRFGPFVVDRTVQRRQPPGDELVSIPRHGTGKVDLRGVRQRALELSAGQSPPREAIA
jgi:hypothetical protein